MTREHKMSACLSRRKALCKPAGCVCSAALTRYVQAFGLTVHFPILVDTDGALSRMLKCIDLHGIHVPTTYILDQKRMVFAVSEYVSLCVLWSHHPDSLQPVALFAL